MLPGQEGFLPLQLPKFLEQIPEGVPLSLQLLPAGGEFFGLRSRSLQSGPLLLQGCQIPAEGLRGLFQSGQIPPEGGQLLLLPAQVTGHLFQGVIGRQLEPEGRDLLLQGLPAGGLFSGLGQIRMGLGHQGLLLRQGPFALEDIILGLPAGQRLGVAGRQVIGGLVQSLLLQQELRLGGFVLIQKAFKEGEHLLHGELALPGLPGIACQQGVLCPADAAQVLADAEICLIPLFPDPAGLGLQPVLQLLVAARAEDVPEDLLPLGGVRLEELAEFTLADHGHLGELLPGDAKDVPDGLVHLPQLGDGPAVGEDQGGIGRLLRGAGAPGLGPVVFRVPADGIGLPVIGEGQLHEGGGLRGGVFAAEHPRLPAVAAGLAEEGEGDRVEDGGLAGTGVAGDQV